MRYWNRRAAQHCLRRWRSRRWPCGPARSSTAATGTPGRAGAVASNRIKPRMSGLVQPRMAQRRGRGRGAARARAGGALVTARARPYAESPRYETAATDIAAERSWRTSDGPEAEAEAPRDSALEAGALRGRARKPVAARSEPRGIFGASAQGLVAAAILTDVETRGGARRRLRGSGPLVLHSIAWSPSRMLRFYIKVGAQDPGRHFISTNRATL